MKHELSAVNKFNVNDAVMVKSVTNPTRRMDAMPYDKPLRVITVGGDGGAYVTNSAGDIKEIHRGDKIGVYKRKQFCWIKWWKLELNKEPLT